MEEMLNGKLSSCKLHTDIKNHRKCLKKENWISNQFSLVFIENLETPKNSKTNTNVIYPN